MTDRDRLIELFDKAQVGCYPISQSWLADHLLANGVIVPPCKVGDTVYFPWVYDSTSGIAILTISSIRLFRQNINLIFYDDVESDMPMPSAFFFDDFGKIVFPTKEEAEAKLRERKEMRY
jgi:hypothetical protein